jgi:hypothetical protein
VTKFISNWENPSQSKRLCLLWEVWIRPYSDALWIDLNTMNYVNRYQLNYWWIIDNVWKTEFNMTT